MIGWNKYIKWGKFTSVNGVELEFKWEFDRLNDEEIDENIILAAILSLAHPHDIIAIHTVNPKKLRDRCRAVYYPKTGVSDGFTRGKYVLYDDVVTTGKSMLDAITHYGKKPERCICIVDRRVAATKNPNVVSIHDVIKNE